MTRLHLEAFALKAQLVVGGNKTVGKFETEFAAAWGIGVQVSNSSDTKLADDKVTLVAAGK